MMPSVVIEPKTLHNSANSKLLTDFEKVIADDIVRRRKKKLKKKSTGT